MNACVRVRSSLNTISIVQLDPHSSLREANTGSPWWAVAAAAGLCLIFLVSIWTCGRAGLSSLLSSYGVKSNQLDALDAAVQFGPRDPESHYLRGTTFEANGEVGEAIAEYRRAVSLRPYDYVLWLSLAQACEANKDSECAIAAARQAVPLAPYYAQPRWQLGNILVRAGRAEEGFAELRLAGASNPTLQPAISDLAWQLSGGNLEDVLKAVQPQTSAAYLALAECFKKRGQVNDAVAMLRSAGSGADDFRRRYVAELLASKQFGEAYAVWSIGHPPPHESDAGFGILNEAGMSNPGFEEESDLVEPGFGWLADTKAPGVALSLDRKDAKAGKSSLLIEFMGNADTAAPVATQLVIVTPNTHYQLHFAARTEAIVSGGLPLIGVNDADNKTPLGGAITFSQPPGNWQDYTLDFTTNTATTAIQIGLRRESCKSPCPIFGRLWLDSFSLHRL